MASVQTTLILGMTADGKISPEDTSKRAKFSAVDFAHLEYQTSLADLILIGAGTIRSEGRTLIIKNPELLAARKVRGQSPQPITCVVSHSLNLPLNIPFFSQEVGRWIFTVGTSLAHSSDALNLSKNAEVFSFGEIDLDWNQAYNLILDRDIRKVVVLGGAALTASLIKSGRIDDWWLTISPTIYGGKNAPTPVQGVGFTPETAPLLELIETRQVGNEMYLHYRLLKG